MGFNHILLYDELQLNIIAMRVAKHIQHDMQKLPIEFHNEKESPKQSHHGYNYVLSIT